MNARFLLNRLIRHERYLVGATVLIFSFLYSYLSYLRFNDFFTGNWDLGIIEQMLWTGSHGYLLFETGDYVNGGDLSFLQIHSTYIAAGFAYIYRLNPVPITLFVIQSVTIASSMVPLYLLARDTGLSKRLSYLCTLAFLLNFSLVSGILFDFHWEAFLPVEFLSLIYLIVKKRFLLALIPFAIGCATLEVFPFLSFGVGIYFAVDRFALSFLSVRRRIHDKEWQFLIFLLALSILSYIAIRTIQLDVIPQLVGAHVHPGAVSGNLVALFNTKSSSQQTTHALLYWGLLYMSFFFIPFLYPKHVILALPWMFATFFINPNFTSSFGNQYALVAISPISVGFVHGLKRVSSRAISWPKDPLPFSLLGAGVFLVVFASVFSNSRILLALNYGRYLWLTVLILICVVSLILISQIVGGYILARDARCISSKSKKLKMTVSSHNLLVIALLLIILFSIAISPLNVNNYKATNQPGYAFKYSSNPEFKYAELMVNFIPANAAVLATNNLFSLVANNPNAYSLPWYRFSDTTWPFFPYNSSNLPHFVFVDSASLVTVPSFLFGLLFNNSFYGLRAFSFYNSYPGSIYLFQLNYSGNPTIFEVSGVKSTYYFGADNLSIGQSGQVVKDSSSLFGYSINSHPASNLSGNGHAIWYGPYFTFLPGNYQVIVSIKGGAFANNSGRSIPILQMNSNSYSSGYYYSRTITSSQLSENNWTEFVYNMSMPEPFPNTEFRGYIVYQNNTANGFVYLNFIEVKYVGPISAAVKTASSHTLENLGMFVDMNSSSLHHTIVSPWKKTEVSMIFLAQYYGHQATPSAPIHAVFQFPNSPSEKGSFVNA